MSIGVMGWVWTHSKSRNGARLVLLAIADAASDDGLNAWPSIATLTRKANLSERAVQTAVKELVSLGELTVEMNAGRNGTNRYSILMATPAESAPPQNLHPADSAGVEDVTESDIDTQDPPQNLHPAESAPPQNSTPTPAESAPKPNTNSPTKKKTSSSSSPTQRGQTKDPEHPRFAEFWDAYAHKVGIGDARKAFSTAIANGADPATLIAAAGRYARHCQRTRKERKYIKQASGWLNSERWHDDLGDEQAEQQQADNPLVPQPRGEHQSYRNPTDPNAYSGGLR